jgi:PucR C-terminal helix-turn-helix domain
MAQAAALTPTVSPRSAPRRQPPGPDLAADIVEVLCPEVPLLAEEIVSEVRRTVPEFDHLWYSRSHTEFQPVVEQMLWRFVDRVADPPGLYERGIESGRRTDQGGAVPALQNAFCVGARVAWRRVAEVGRRAGWPAETMALLADEMFAFAEEIAESSARPREAPFDRLGDLRRRLLEAVLTTGPAVPRAALADLARKAQWRLPVRVACVAVAGRRSEAGRMTPPVGADVLMDLQRPDPCLLVPDPDAPGRQEMLARALRDTPFAIGISVPLADAALSLRLAVQALALVKRGVIDCDRYVRCRDVLSTVLLFQNEDVVGAMAQRRYAPLAALRPLQRLRLSETLLSWLMAGGQIPETAAHMRVHAQTVRYRLRQLRELFGEEMDDPDWRFEMEIILRTEASRRAAR